MKFLVMMRGSSSFYSDPSSFDRPRLYPDESVLGHLEGISSANPCWIISRLCLCVWYSMLFLRMLISSREIKTFRKVKSLSIYRKNKK